MKAKKILIVGAGPGGLSCGMLLNRQGHRVIMVDKEATVGGRNRPLKMGPYTFDTGPTFFLMKDVLERIFAATGRRLEDVVELSDLDPMCTASSSATKRSTPRAIQSGCVPKWSVCFPAATHSTNATLPVKRKNTTV